MTKKASMSATENTKQIWIEKGYEKQEKNRC